MEVMTERLALNSQKNAATTTTTLGEYFGTKKARGVSTNTCTSPASSTMTATTCSSTPPSSPVSTATTTTPVKLAPRYSSQQQDGGDEILDLLLKQDTDNLDLLLESDSEYGNNDNDPQDDDDDSDSVFLCEEEDGEEVLGEDDESRHSLSLSSGSSSSRHDRNGEVDMDLEFVHQLEVAFMTDIGEVSHQLESLHNSGRNLDIGRGSQHGQSTNEQHVHEQKQQQHMHHNHEHEHDHHHNHHHQGKHSKKNRASGGATTSQSLATLPTTSWDTEEEEDYEEEYQDYHLHDYRSYEQQSEHGHGSHDHAPHYHHHHHHYHHYHHHYHHYGYDEEERKGTPSPSHHLQPQRQQRGEECARQQKQQQLEQEKQPDTRHQQEVKQHHSGILQELQDFGTSEASLLEEEIELGLQELERILRDLDEDIYDQDDDRRPSNMTQKTTATDNPDPVMTKATMTEDSTSNRRISSTESDDAPPGISPQIMDEFLFLDRFLQEELHDLEETVHVLDSHSKCSSRQQQEGMENGKNDGGAVVSHSGADDEALVVRTESNDLKDIITNVAEGLVVSSFTSDTSLLSFVWGNQWYHPRSDPTATRLADSFSIVGRHLLYKTIVPCLYRQQCVLAKANLTATDADDGDLYDSLASSSATNCKSLAPAVMASATATAAIGTVLLLANFINGVVSTRRAR